MRLKIKDGILIKAKINKNDNNVILPSNVTCIGERAFFKSKKNLKKIELGDSIEYIEHAAFHGCEELREIELPSSIKEISDFAFYGCSGLEHITIPSLIKVIHNCTFSDCSKLKSVYFSDNLKRIGESAFKDCISLDNIKLSNSLEIIGAQAFYFCANLKRISIPETVKYINNRAFSTCKRLEKIELPPLLKKISDETFSFCSNLKQVKIPSSVEIIDNRAFKSCSSLEKIVLPLSLKYIGSGAFEYCRNLKTVKFSNCVKEIDFNAFKECVSLKQIKLNDGLEIIGREAFSECRGLEKIEIPSTVRTIGCDAFISCDKLKFIKINNVYNLFEEGIISLSNDFDYYYNKETKDIILSKEPLNGLVGYEKVNDNINVRNDKLKTSEKVALSIMFGKEGLDRLKYVSPILASICRDSKGEFNYNCLYDYKEFYNLQKRLFKDKIIVGIEVYYDLFKFASAIGAFSENGKDRQRACEFISNAFDKGYFDFDNFHGIFNSLDYRSYNEDIAEFIMNKENFSKLIDIEQEYNTFISRVFNDFENIKEFGRSNRGSQRYRKVTIDMSKEYLSKVDFIGVNDDNLDVAEEVSKYTHFQRSFDFAKEIREEYINLKEQSRVKEHILGEEISGCFEEIDKVRKNIVSDVQEIFNNLNGISNSKFSYEFLSKYDPRNFTLGKYCSCCAHIDGEGMGIVKASILHPDCQNLVIKDSDGKIIAKSTLYINRNYGYGVFNTIKINSSYLTKENRKLIYKNYIEAINSFVKKYNEMNPNNPLKQINVGMNMNDLSEEIIRNGNQRSKKILRCINFKDYAGNYEGDWKEEQYVIFTSNEKKEKMKDKK